MRELLSDYERLWGSAPRPEGAVLLATKSGGMAGSVSGGCVENAVVEEILAALERQTPKTLEYGVTHERAWEFGLSCGGTISLFVEPTIRPELLEAARRPEGSVVATVTSGAAPVGTSLVILEDGTLTNLGAPEALEAPVKEAALEALGGLNSKSVSVSAPEGEVRVLLEVFPREPTLLIFGGVHIATALVTLAKPLGFRVVVADARDLFLTKERFPNADELIVGWPDEVFAKIGIDSATCLCLLTHDPKFDEPAIDAALKSNAAYIGVIGSRKTQALRRERLADVGFSAEDIARIHGPIGLDLGGREPAEIALAILAEITAARYRGKIVRKG